MNVLVKRVVMPLGIVSLMLAASCAGTEEKQSPLAGILYGGSIFEIDPDRQVVRYYEDGIDGLSEVRVRNVKVIDDNRIEFEAEVSADDEYEPASIAYNPEDSLIHYSFGADGMLGGHITNKIDKIAAPDLTEENSYIYEDTLYTKKLAPYKALDQLTVKGITRDGYVVEVPGKGEGYVSMKYFEPVLFDLREALYDQRVFQGFENDDKEYLTNVVIKANDDDVVMSMDTYPANGMGAAWPTRYRAGKVLDGKLIFDKESTDMDAFDNFDLSKFTNASDTIKAVYFYGFKTNKERLLINEKPFKEIDL